MGPGLSSAHCETTPSTSVCRRQQKYGHDQDGKWLPGLSPVHLPIICAQSGNKNQMARMKLKFKRAKIYMYDAVCQLM